MTPTLLTALRQGDTPVLGWSPVLPQGWPGWHLLAQLAGEDVPEEEEVGRKRAGGQKPWETQSLRW